MREIIRTNDMVLLSFVEAVLTELGVKYLIADQGMSVMDGSVGILARRVLIDENAVPGILDVLADPAIYPYLVDKVRAEVDDAQ